MATQPESIWSRIDNFLSQNLNSEYETGRTVINEIIQNYGNIFNETPESLNPAEEQFLYLYHYGENSTISTKYSPEQQAVLNTSSPYHQISTALLVFAACVKYLEISENEEPYPEITKYLDCYPLLKQSNYCRKLLEKEVRTSTQNTTQFLILRRHALACENVRKSICNIAKIPYLTLNLSKSPVETSDSAEAALSFLKGHWCTLISSISGTEKSCFQYYQKAADLEPEFCFWWLIIYLELRNKPTSANYVIQTLQFAQEALEFAPWELQLRTKMCLLNASLEHAYHHKKNFRLLTNWNLLLSIFEEVDSRDLLELHSKWISLRASELIIRYSTISQEMALGVKLLEKCVTEFPTCFLSLEALAQAHENHRFNEMFLDKRRALELFTTVKAIHPTKQAGNLFSFHIPEIAQNFEPVACSSKSLFNSSSTVPVTPLFTAHATNSTKQLNCSVNRLLYKPDSIFDWIKECIEQELGVSDKAQIKGLGDIVQNYVFIFSEKRFPITSEIEEFLYLYHYGEIEHGSRRISQNEQNCLVTSGPYESLSAALLVFAAAVCYTQVKNSKFNTQFLNQILENHPLNKQAEKCRRCLENEISNSCKNPGSFYITRDHVFAYEQVLEAICKFADIPYNCLEIDGLSGLNSCENSAQAAYCFLKGQIYTLVKTVYEKQFTAFPLYYEATILEPNCFFWWYVSHLEMKNKTTSAYTECSLHLSEKANLLAPNQLQLRTPMFVLNALVDEAKVNRQYFRNPTKWEALLSVFNEVKHRPREPSEFHVKWISLRSSELVIRFSNNIDEARMGVDLIRTCCRKFGPCNLSQSALSAIKGLDGIQGALGSLGISKASFKNWPELKTYLTFQFVDADALIKPLHYYVSNNQGSLLSSSNPVSPSKTAKKKSKNRKTKSKEKKSKANALQTLQKPEEQNVATTQATFPCTSIKPSTSQEAFQLSNKKNTTLSIGTSPVTMGALKVGSSSSHSATPTASTSAAVNSRTFSKYERAPMAFLKISDSTTSSTQQSTGDIFTYWINAIKDIQLECPVTWVSTSVQRIPDCILKFSKDKNSYPQSCFRKKEFTLYNTQKPAQCKLSSSISDCSSESESVNDADDDEDEEEITNDDNPVVGSDQWFCAKLCHAALALYLKRQGMFSQISTTFKNALKIEEVCSDLNKNIYKLHLEANELCGEYLNLKVREFHTQPGYRSRWRILQKQMQNLNTKLKEVKNTAVVHYIKGKIASMLGLAHDVSLGHYRKAAETEPTNPLWYQFIYEELKKMRKSGFNKLVPNSEEIRACQKAHELSPDNPKYAMDLVTVKMAVVSGENEEKSKWVDAERKRKIQEIHNLLKFVMDRAEDNSRYTMLAKLTTAEMYTAKGFPQRVTDAEAIFTECYKKWPKSSMVLHKMAKFYCKTCRKYQKSRELLQEAMQVAPRNYPCLMDYLKLLGRYLKSYPEMIQIIDKYLPSINDNQHTANLMIIKGQAYWLQKENIREMRDNACNAWLDVIQNFPHLSFKVKDALTSKSSSVFGRLEIPIAILYPICSEQQSKREMLKGKEIDDFLAFLEKDKRQGVTKTRIPNYNPREATKNSNLDSSTHEEY